jgi:DNA ligase-1
LSKSVSLSKSKSSAKDSIPTPIPIPISVSISVSVSVSDGQKRGALQAVDSSTEISRPHGFQSILDLGRKEQAAAMTTLSDLAATSRDLAATRARSAKVARLAALLRTCAEHEIGLAALWLTGETGRQRLGIGPAQVDAVRCVAPAAEPRLGLGEAAARLDAITALDGSGSKARRIEALSALFAAATPEEQRFLARLLLGELRQGALAALVLDALGAAFDIPVGSVRRAQMLRGDIAEVAATARAAGRAGLDAIGLTVFRAVQPMLAQPAQDLDDALRLLPRPILEYKLDGARVQIHKAGTEVRVFSRQGNDVTVAVPEIVTRVAALPARELVLDGETLVLAADGSPLPFQITMRRFGRRRFGSNGDDPELRTRLPLAVFCFDCLALDGETLIDAPTSTRHAALAEAVPPDLIIPRLDPSRDGSDPAGAAGFLARALAAGHEGLMAKDPQAPYAAGGRGSHWLKIKQTQTLDLVVLAAETGSGRRSGWLSNLHLGARDGSGGFVMLGKTFKGLSDQTLSWQTEQLLAREIGRDGQVVQVRPELVVEIAFNELQQSRQYPAGLALRFARVKRYRPDKTAADADHIDSVRAIFERQVAYRAGGAGGATSR